MMNARLTIMALWIVVAIPAMDILSQPIQLRIPIEGEQDKTWILVNHVDHDDDSARIQDAQCGVRTYDGHDGTDFVLRSFRAMDSGVYVLAAAEGVVTYVMDAEPDRNKVSVRERGFGNVITIRHRGGVTTTYAHLRTGSALVRAGERVQAGQRIGLVGSSGNSSDPHLHFEVWQRQDLLTGGCGVRPVQWIEDPAFPQGYRLFDADVTTWPPLLDTIRERPPHPVITGTDSTITFWSLQGGIQATDRIEVEWFTPDGLSWFRYATDAGLTTEYYYMWTYIATPAQSGTWSVVQRVNGIQTASVSFSIGGTSGIVNQVENGAWLEHRDGVLHVHPDIIRVDLHTLDGRHIRSHTTFPVRVADHGIHAIVATARTGHTYRSIMYFAR